MSTNKKFPTKNIRPTPFKLTDENKIIYLTYDMINVNYSGIFEYNIQNDTHKKIASCHNATGHVAIYNKTKHEIIIVGDNATQKHKKSIKIFNFENKEHCNIKNKGVNIKIGHDAALALSNNDKMLHIIGGSHNSYHYMYNLTTNQIENQYPFHDTNPKITNHALLYNSKTNLLHMFGGISSDNDVYFNDFWTLNLNKNNKKQKIKTLQKTSGFSSEWIKNENRKLSKKLSSFGYILYKNRIIIIFGGRTDGIFSYDSKQIFYIDLENENKWKESKQKCAKKGRCHAVLVDDKVYIFPYYDYNNYFVININKILPETLMYTLEEKEEFKCSECDNLRQENDALKQTLNLLNTEEILNSLRNENKELKMKVEILQKWKTEHKHVDYDYTLLKERFQVVENENIILKKDNSSLYEDCKEYELKIHKIERMKTMDTRDYKTWNDSIIVDWILSLDNGVYEQYENVLRVKLKEEQMRGILLDKLSTNDLHRFGIKAFAHKSAIIEHIEMLTSTPKEEGVTAYI